MTALERFAKEVLEILESDKDWSADTIDAIARAAHNLDLTQDDPEGHFKVRR